MHEYWGNHREVVAAVSKKHYPSVIFFLHLCWDVNLWSFFWWEFSENHRMHQTKTDHLSFSPLSHSCNIQYGVTHQYDILMKLILFCFTHNKRNRTHCVTSCIVCCVALLSGMLRDVIHWRGADCGNQKVAAGLWGVSLKIGWEMLHFRHSTTFGLDPDSHKKRQWNAGAPETANIWNPLSGCVNRQSVSERGDIMVCYPHVHSSQIAMWDWDGSGILSSYVYAYGSDEFIKASASKCWFVSALLWAVNLFGYVCLF